MLLVEKITKAMCMLFDSAENVNYNTDQLLVLKMVPIVIKATKYHEDVEAKGAHHRIHSFLEKGLRFLSMINKYPLTCTAKENCKDESRYFFYLVNLVCMSMNPRKTLKNVRMQNLKT